MATEPSMPDEDDRKAFVCQFLLPADQVEFGSVAKFKRLLKLGIGLSAIKLQLCSYVQLCVVVVCRCVLLFYLGRL